MLRRFFSHLHCTSNHRTVAAVNDSLDTSKLRWVGTHFIYFLDIPWKRRGMSIGQLSLKALTFDLLEEVLDMEIPIKQMLFRDSHGRGISGESLSRLIVPWARALHAAAPNPEHCALGERVTKIMIHVLTALEDTVYATDTPLIYRPEAYMLFTVLVLLDALSRCVRAIWGDGPLYAFSNSRTRLLGEMPYFLRAVLQRSWGRSSEGMERLLISGPVPFVAYATECPPTINNVETVDTVHYKPRHVNTSCHCAYILPRIEDVSRFLQDGKVTTVVFDGHTLVVQAACEGPYVAISHVWADGLGSHTEQGLPLCQVKRLNGLIRQLNPSGAFWQDGVCVPEAETLRRRAIGLMARTYEEADKVLVIDSGVRTCSLQSGPEEYLLRIATSGWMQRIWTLQEGMLARELHFEVDGGIIDCTCFNGTAYDYGWGLIPLLHYRRKNDGSSEYQQRLLSPPKCTLNNIIELLRHRSTSHPRDEPLAISGLLGVDATEFVKYEDGEERMRMLLLRVGTLPRTLAIFGWSCRRLSLESFTWAPLSFSEVLWPGEAEDPLGHATCTSEGLFGDYAVVHIPEITITWPYGVIARVVQEGCPEVAGAVADGPAVDSRDIINLVLSPYFFSRTESRLTFNAFNLMLAPTMPDATHETAVGVVRVLSGLEAVPLHCKFVAPGSARLGLPDNVETVRANRRWRSTDARMMNGVRRIRLT